MSDVRWLTYDEIASELGIARESARQLAIRKRWPRQKGNDGRARIGVPEEEFTARTSDSTVADPSPPPSDHSSPVMVLTQHIKRLERELEQARERVKDRDSIAAQLEALRAVLEVERQRAAELREERDRWHATAMASRPCLLTRLRRALG